MKVLLKWVWVCRQFIGLTLEVLTGILVALVAIAMAAMVKVALLIQGKDFDIEELLMTRVLIEFVDRIEQFK